MSNPANVHEESGIEHAAPAVGAAPRTALPDSDTLLAETIARHGNDPDFVTALARGLAVLLALSDKKRRMSIAQVSHRTGIPRAAVRRSLHTLAELGFVAADDALHFYLRPRVLSFSHGYLSASPIAGHAQPILDRLGASLREACSLATLDGDEIVYLARSTSSRIMSPTLNVGRRLPAYCTSIGHVMLAQLPLQELDYYLARTRFHPYTAHTPNSVAALLSLLSTVRDSGFAFASQLMESRLCTLAVPVHDIGGNCVAGINVILQDRLIARDEMAERFYQPLHGAALELGLLLAP